MRSPNDWLQCCGWMVPRQRAIIRSLRPYSELLYHDDYLPQGNLADGKPFVCYDGGRRMVFIDCDGQPKRYKGKEWMKCPLHSKLTKDQLRSLFELATKYASGWKETTDLEPCSEKSDLFPGFLFPAPQYLGALVMNPQGTAVGAFIYSQGIKKEPPQRNAV